MFSLAKTEIGGEGLRSILIYIYIYIYIYVHMFEKYYYFWSVWVLSFGVVCILYQSKEIKQKIVRSVHTNFP